jgi:biopolymer transport protein ExbD
MKYTLKVCLITFALMSVAIGQNAAPQSISTPTLRKGISVQMAVTKNAVAVPKADEEDALVVVITRTGATYLITKPMTTSALEKRIKDELRNSPDKKVYLKADARTPYADVLRVCSSLLHTGVNGIVLLTSQGHPEPIEQPVTPEGLAVLLGPGMQGTEAISVQVLHTKNGQPTAMVEGKAVPWSDLSSSLAQANANFVVLRAEEKLPFADVVQVVDASQANGKTVTLSPAGI